MKSRRVFRIALPVICLSLIVSVVDAQKGKDKKTRDREASSSDVTNPSKAATSNRRNPEGSNSARKKDDTPVKANTNDKPDPPKPGGKTEELPRPDDTSKNATQNSSGAKRETWVPSWVILVASVLLGLLAVGLMGYAVFWLVGKVTGEVEAYFADVRRRQKDLSNKLDNTMSALDKNLMLRFSGIENGIKEISRAMETNHQELMKEVRQARIVPAPAYPAYSDAPPAIKEEGIPFPLAVSSLLSRVTGNKEVVTTDFQNNILVNDPEGRGELVLIRDNTVPDGLTLAIPADPNFRTKQDFHNYYERYYDCNRPSSGEVWIVEPAVVDKVTGGWKLREKGLLEVK